MSNMINDPFWRRFLAGMMLGGALIILFIVLSEFGGTSEARMTTVSAIFVVVFGVIAMLGYDTHPPSGNSK